MHGEMIARERKYHKPAVQWITEERTSNEHMLVPVVVVSTSVFKSRLKAFMFDLAISHRLNASISAF